MGLFCYANRKTRISTKKKSETVNVENCARHLHSHFILFGFLFLCYSCCVWHSNVWPAWRNDRLRRNLANLYDSNKMEGKNDYLQRAISTFCDSHFSNWTFNRIGVKSIRDNTMAIIKSRFSIGLFVIRNEWMSNCWLIWYGQVLWGLTFGSSGTWAKRFKNNWWGNWTAGFCLGGNWFQNYWQEIIWKILFWGFVIGFDRNAFKIFLTVTDCWQLLVKLVRFIPSDFFSFISTILFYYFWAHLNLENKLKE